MVLTRKTLTVVIAAVMGVVGCGVGSASAQSRQYIVRPQSEFFEGCFELCRCLVIWMDDLNGRFTLTRAAPDEHFQYYTVTNTQFSLPTVGWEYTQAAGTTGTYQIGGDPALTNRLQLDLNFEGNIWHFDSGVVLTPGSPGAWPVITIDINRNNLECFDTVFSLVASRAGDWNADGQSTVQDVFMFLADFFAGRGDIDGDGQSNVADIFAFLADYFDPS